MPQTEPDRLLRANLERVFNERDAARRAAAVAELYVEAPVMYEPDKLVEQLRADEAIAEADTLLLTVPNQLGVDYNAHVIESILTHVAPALGWRDKAPALLDLAS